MRIRAAGQRVQLWSEIRFRWVGTLLVKIRSNTYAALLGKAGRGWGNAAGLPEPQQPEAEPRRISFYRRGKEDQKPPIKRAVVAIRWLRRCSY